MLTLVRGMIMPLHWWQEDQITQQSICYAVILRALKFVLAVVAHRLQSHPSDQYRFTYDWDPIVGLPDGDYDFRCEISDGTNSSTTAFADNLDELTLDSTSPTVLEVREASGGGGSYSEDDDLVLEIEFSEVVVIAGGTGLSLELDVNEIVGLQGATASYFGGSGSNVLRFRYIVEDSSWAETSDLGYPDQAALTLSGSTTLADSVGNSADLTLPTPWKREIAERYE